MPKINKKPAAKGLAPKELVAWKAAPTRKAASRRYTTSGKLQHYILSVNPPHIVSVSTPLRCENYDVIAALLGQCHRHEMCSNKSTQ